MDWTSIIIAALGGGAIVALINAVANKQKTAAEVEESLTAIAKSLVVTYREEVADLRCRLDVFEVEIKGRDMRISELEGKVKALTDENKELRDQNTALIRENKKLNNRLFALERKVENGKPPADSPND